MIKTRLGRRKGEDSLRPLTEREIQEKLYGSYLTDQSGAEQKSEARFVGSTRDSTRKEKLVILSPRRKTSFSAPKISFKVPWRGILSFLFNGLRIVWDILKTLLVRVMTGWGIGVVAVVSIFLSIHMLNAYRATAMKNFKIHFELKPYRKRTIHERRHQVEQKVQAVGTSSVVLTPTTPGPEVVVKDEAPPPVSVAGEKSYVIQICTYSREEDAQKLVEQIGQSNLSAFLQPVQRSSGKTFYLVLLGRFESFTEAQAKLEEFRQNPIAKDFPDSFVRTL